MAMGAWNMNRESAAWHEAPLSLLYTVLTAILLGAVLVDITYASVLRNVLTAEQKLQVYAIVSDSMPHMLVAFLALLAGVAGALLAGSNRRARWMLGISVALLVGVNIVIPMFLKDVRVDDSPGLGPLIRIVVYAMILILAILACLSWRRPRHS